MWGEYWPKLQNVLAKRTLVRNWTKDSGEIGDSFAAISTHNSVRVELPRGGVRNIYFGEIEAMYRLWEGYLSGRTRRSRIATAHGLVNSKYIISILHQFQHLM